MKQTPNRSAEENNNRSIESVEKIQEDKTLKKTRVSEIANNLHRAGWRYHNLPNIRNWLNCGSKGMHMLGCKFWPCPMCVQKSRFIWAGNVLKCLIICWWACAHWNISFLFFADNSWTWDFPLQTLTPQRCCGMISRELFRPDTLRIWLKQFCEEIGVEDSPWALCRPNLQLQGMLGWGNCCRLINYLLNPSVHFFQSTVTVLCLLANTYH